MRLLVLSLCLLWPLSWAQAQDAQPPIAQASLISETTAITGGQQFRVAVRLQPKEGWHTYWQNPGDSGLATRLSWTLPEGFTASDIDWPTPQRFTEGPLVVHGYAGDVLLPVTLTPPADLVNTATLRVKAEWLVCKEICIPESAELTLDLPAGAPSPSADASLFTVHDAQKRSVLEGSFAVSGDKIALDFPLASSDVSSAYFLPETSNIIKYSGTTTFDTDGTKLRITYEHAGEMPQGALSGIVLITDATGGKQAYDVTLNNTTAPVVSAPAALPEAPFFPYILLLALLGGVVLNLMPCVLPVLSLKALSIVKKSGSHRSQALQHGIAYTAGILLSFATLATVLIALQQTGEAVGWGYQMQSPVFVGFLIYLLFLVGLNLSGAFDLPVLLGGVSVSNQQSPSGSFFTGILATAVATPCTAPFMATAVGAALSFPAWQAMLVFLALGFGLALPFLLISAFPACLKFLPKPGAWMERFKQFLALPMYGSVIWLMWVLTLQTGAMGMVIAATGLLGFAFLLWLRHFTAPILIVAMALAIFGFSLPMLSDLEPAQGAAPASHNAHNIATQPYNAQVLAELRAKGTPVYVDATAAWCITCQVNARVALHTPRTMQTFADTGTVLMIADWTRRDDAITAWLASFGYQGVPLNVFYPARGEPVVLPQLLSEDIVINHLKGER